MSRWGLQAALVAVALMVVTLGRAAYECRTQLQLGRAAEGTGDHDGARLHFGAALLWRVPIVSSFWADAAERSLRAMPSGPRATLAGADRSDQGAIVAANNDSTTDGRFGRTPSAPLAGLGGLALLAALAAAARWAWTARRSWAVVTLAGGIVAAISLWAA